MLLGTLAFGCNHASKASTPGCCEKTESSRAAEPGTETTGLPEAGSATLSPIPRFRKEEGCARDFQSSGAALQDVQALERLCARGMAPMLAEPASRLPTPAGAVEVPFAVTASTCLRAAAVAATGGLSVALLDPRGAPVANASSLESYGVVPVDGTVCVRETGTYRALVGLSSGPADAANVIVQIWQASRD